MRSWEVINKSFADCLKLKSSFNLISFLTDLIPFVSQANFVNNNFSSGLSTFPVKKILPSSTLDFTESKCYKKNTLSSIGRVSEYPDEKNVIKWYVLGIEKEKLNNRNIYKEIDLNKYIKYLEKKSIKINMSTIQESLMYKNEPKKIKFKIKSNLENEYQDFSLNKLLYSTKNKNLLKEWWDSNTINKIKIFDNIDNSSGIFAIETTDDKDYLLNKNKVIIGEVREWKNDIIDSYFKNSNNVILDPYTHVPILEYEIYRKTSIYHNLASGIYREYRYNEEEDDFINTNSIELL